MIIQSGEKREQPTQVAKRKAAVKKAGGKKNSIVSVKPIKKWGFDRLQDHAANLSKEITKFDRHKTKLYWRLGETIECLLGDLTPAQRKMCLRELEERGVDKTRRSKAKAIFSHFTSINDLKGLTVEDAYKAASTRRSPKKGVANRKVNKPAPPKEKRESLPAFLENVHRGLQEFRFEAEAVETKEERQHCLEQIERIAAEIKQLEEALRRDTK